MQRNGKTRHQLYRIILLVLGWCALLPAIVHAAGLTISDGVVVKFGADAGLEVRDSLQASGHVVFTSVKDDAIDGQTGASVQTPAPGDWRGVNLEPSAASALQLTGLTVRYAGSSGQAGVNLRKVSPTLSYLAVDNSSLGVRVSNGGAPQFRGLSLQGNGVGLEVDSNAAPVLTGSDIHGNTSLGISNTTPATVVQATGAWWGDSTGPKDPAGNPGGKGDAVSAGVNYGSWATVIPLINPQLSVANLTVTNNVSYTSQAAITLNLSCVNAVQYRVAENAGFAGVPFAPMVGSAPFTLSSGDGLKQISVQYQATDGNIVTAAVPQGVLYVTSGPTLAITNPTTGSYINNSITISATATSPAGVARVEFYINGALASTSTAAPYSYSWNVGSLADGPYSIQVIAYDAIGNTTTATSAITLAKAAPPPPDTQGPTLASLSLGGTAVASGATLTRSGTLTVSASDPSGVSSVQFFIDGSLVGSGVASGGNYSIYLNLYSLTDGAHTLAVRAYDSLNNLNEQDVNITVALAPPVAPTLTAPANGFVTNQTQVTVSGSAERGSQATIFSNGAPVAGPLNLDANGNFSATVTLANGANQLQAAATNRGGTGPLSAALQLTLNLSVPSAPVGLAAVSQAGGKIQLTWNQSLDPNVTGYYVYRSTVAFTNTSEAFQVTAKAIPVGTTGYTDLPSADGTYYYRIVAVNSFGTPSAPSSQVSAVSDSTPPQALSIVYAPTGHWDPATGRIAVGTVNVTVTVSKPLVTAPFLSITPQNGTPISVTLSASSSTVYQGSFAITPQTPSGTAYAVFSARDLVGNRGTNIVSGGSILIDAQGPTLTGIALQPGSPIKNDPNTPVSVGLTLTFNKAMGSGSAPQLSFVLANNPSAVIPVTGLTQTATLTWTGSLTLPASAGASQGDSLAFTYSGVDDLANVSTLIAAQNSFQVYQGNLPPLATPLNFTAVAQPKGQVLLNWGTVATAAGYQIYRQAPGETALTPYQQVTTSTNFATTSYTDATTADGLYTYAVASIRQANGQQAVSAQSNPVQATALSVPPAAPQNLALALTGSGIVATWTAPASGTVATYNLYRSSAATITSVQGLTPLITGIKQLGAVDASPSLTQHAYVATALDAAGNESAPSNSMYLDFALLPVNNLTVVQNGSTLPVLTWTESGSTVVGYNVYLGPANAQTLLNLTPLSGTTYTDSGYAGDERRYTVVAYDANNNQIGRSITLPQLAVTLVSGTPLQLGLMNQLQYQVTNQGASEVDGVTLTAAIGAHQNSSDPFNLPAGASQLVNVVVGGYADIPSQATLSTTIQVAPEAGELVKIVRSQGISAQNGAMVISATAANMTRGATGQVSFTIQNTSAVPTQILTALQSGQSPSSDIRLQILDQDGNVIATQPFQQALGANVVTLPSGQTVATLDPGASFTSNPIALNIPLSAPDQVTVQLVIDHYYYQLGTANAVTIAGQTARQAATLIDTSYYATITSISPASSFGDQNVVIQGQAIARATNAPLPNVDVKLILSINGFQQRYDVYTDTSGNFSYSFTPPAGVGGVYQVAAVHPAILDIPVQGQFVIDSLVLQYATYTLNNPRNYPFTINEGVTTGGGTQMTNLHFVYQASDQPSGNLPVGVTVTPAAPITLGPKQHSTLGVTVTGDSTAATTGSFVLTAYADERPNAPVGRLTVNYQLTDAKPALFSSPSYVEVGLAQGASTTTQVTLENRGFSDAQGITATLLNPDGTPAPAWVYLASSGTIANLAVGQKQTFDIGVAAPPTQANGIYNFILRIAAANAQGGDVPVYVALTDSGVGNMLVKASDIYTGTLDSQGNVIPGLAGATITLQNESVLSVSQQLITDSTGQAYFTNVPAGQYSYLVSAPNHQQTGGYITIQPGVTANQSVFLDYNLVTVQWSVTQTTIQDVYNITLNATYQTNVPAAVVALQPASVTIPPMQPGDVFYGELTLTNNGLVRADNVTFTPPPGDSFFRIDFLTQVPTSLEAKQKLTLPYRIVSLSSLTQPAGTATGGGCGTWLEAVNVAATSICVNGSISHTSASTSFVNVYGSCPGGAGSGSSAASGSSGGSGSGGGGGGGGGGFVGGGPSFTPLPNAPCVPGTPCSCQYCGGGNGSGNGGNGNGSPDGSP